MSSIACTRFRVLGVLFAAVSTLTSGAALGADDKRDATNAPSAETEQLKRTLERMEQRIQMLEGQLKQAQSPPAPGSAKPATPAKPANPKAPDWAQPSATPNAPASDTADTKPATATKPTNPKAPDWAQTSTSPSTPGGTASAANPTTSPSSGTTSPLSASPAAASPSNEIRKKRDTWIGRIAGHGPKHWRLRRAGLRLPANPAAGGQWQNGFDAHRLVLLPTYQITDNIIFNAEIEFEHGGTGFDGDDKLHGTAEIEQLWIDFKIVDAFNWRAPGIDLIPIGYINEHHEPTQFYSVKRPELYLGLIPSTWKAPATSVYGRITDGLTYTIQASSSLEDFGDAFSVRTDANTVPPFPIGYFPGIDGLNALAFSLPVRGDFRQLSNDIAVAAQLNFSPPILPGFDGSVSGYYTPNTTPRGAYADTGAPLGRSSLAMFDAEFRYRIPKTGWEFRGEYVSVTFGNPANLRANNDTDPTDNVGNTMYGYSGEVAYHYPLGTILNSEWEAVPFYRYTYQNTQTGGYTGTDLNFPMGAGQTQFHNIGIAVFPSPKIVLKATYQKVHNRDPLGARSDSVLGGVGFFF